MARKLRGKCKSFNFLEVDSSVVEIDGEVQKYCPSCDKTLKQDNFGKHNSHKDKYQLCSKSCKNESNKMLSPCRTRDEMLKFTSNSRMPV